MEAPFVESFVIDTDIKARWAVRKISEAKQEKADLKAWYDAQYQKACEECDNTIARMEIMLQSYFNSIPDNVKKVTKSQIKYSMAGADLILKPKTPKYTPDKEKMLAFVKADPMLKDYIKVTETADCAGLKKVSEDVEVSKDVFIRVMKDTGEILPVEVIVEDEFKVSLKEEEADE